MTRKLLLGDEAIALGALHAGLSGVYAYPGTPSTEITEFIQNDAYAKEHGMLFAMTECGYKNSPDATWWSRVLRPMMDKHPLCYFLAWRNAQHEHFGCAPGLATADDFKQMAKRKTTLFVKDMKKIK